MQCFTVLFFLTGPGLIFVSNAHNLERTLHDRLLLGPQHQNAIEMDVALVLYELRSVKYLFVIERQ